MEPFTQAYDCVSVREPEAYPLLDGRIISGSGLDIAPSDYDEHFEEEHLAHSNALHSSLRRNPYLVGPIARFNLNYDRLGARARAAAESVSLAPNVANPFQGIIVRAVELVDACDVSLAILERYTPPAAPGVPVTPRSARNAACSEAPRGMLFHRYTTDSRGLVLDAKIVPPSAQNLQMMERDLGAFVAARADWDERQLTWRCEQAVRNYDPCISCATHFLTLTIERD